MKKRKLVFNKLMVLLLMLTLVMSYYLPVKASAVEIEKTYSNQNLLINPGFEETQNPDEFEGNAFKGWNVESDATTWSTLFADGPSRTGEVAGTTWCESNFNMSVTQPVTVQKDGTYKASIWIARGLANFGEVMLRVKLGDTVVGSSMFAATEMNKDTNYYGLEVRDLKLTQGDYTYEVLIPCTQAEVKDDWTNNAFVRLDDAYFGVQDNNILVNPSFDQTQVPEENDGNTFVGWNVESDATTWSVLFADKPARTGAATGTTWCESNFNMLIQQTVNVTVAGKYSANVWVARGAANFGEAELHIKKDDVIVATSSIAALADNDYFDYVQIEIPEVDLEAGEYLYEVYIPCTQSEKEGFEKNAFARIDDAYLGLVEENNMVNVLTNGSFEETQDANENDGNSFVGWEVESDATTWSVLFGGGQSRTGKNAGITWCESDYNMTITQKTTIKEEGDYTGSVWLSLGNANFNDVQLILMQNNSVISSGKLKTVEKNTDTQYKQIIIPTVTLAEGELEFIISIPCTQVAEEGFKNNAFARVDDAFLAKISLETEEIVEATQEPTIEPTNEPTSEPSNADTVDQVSTESSNTASNFNWVLVFSGIAVAVIGIACVMIIKKKKTNSK